MNSLDVVGFEFLEDKTFFIPDYQRGYRWDEYQVTKLLDDLYQFEQNRTGEESYSLQPLVVYWDNGQYEVIDGQQRLTTIFLLAKFFGISDNLFTISYQTRTGSADYIKKITVTDTADRTNIDYWYMSNAYNAISGWINKSASKTERSDREDDVKRCLKKSVKFIWYEVTETTSKRIEIFNRLNIGKIKLTNAELIKALMLNESNFPKNQTDADKYPLQKKQMEHDRNQLAVEWDEIEKKLHDPELWGFLNSCENDTSNRIDTLFQFYVLSKGGELKQEFSVFEYIEPSVKLIKGSQETDKAPVLILWNDFVKFFYTLVDWYENIELFHIVGFLVSAGKPVYELYRLYEGKTKSDFKNDLIEIINSPEIIPNDLDSVKYSTTGSNAPIERVLLLFNILSILHSSSHDERISFNKYHSSKNKWSIEHIHAQDSELLQKKDQRETWIKDHIKLLGEKAEASNDQNASVVFDEYSKVDISILTEDSRFAIVHETILKALTGGQSLPDIHALGNLALLDKDTNSAFNNSVFEQKTRIMKRRISEGHYILPATRNVFFKYYTTNPGALYYWSINDFYSYHNCVVEAISKYLGRKYGAENE